MRLHVVSRARRRVLAICTRGSSVNVNLPEKVYKSPEITRKWLGVPDDITSKRWRVARLGKSPSMGGDGDFKSPCGDLDGDFILSVCKAYHFLM